MSRPAVIVFLVLGVIVIIQMLVTGRASPSKYGFTKEDDPVIYWAVFIAALVVILSLLYVAVFDGTSKFLP